MKKINVENDFGLTVEAATVANVPRPDKTGWNKQDTVANNAHRARMRDVADEESNKNDIVGTLLRGEDWTISVLVTYNRQNNTYYMNYNSTIIPEAEIAFGVWKDLTDLGTIKVRNLRKLYEEKMPQRLRELDRKLKVQETPSETDMLQQGFNPLPQGSIIPSRIPADGDTLLEYDLDNVHLSSVKITKADIDPTSTDEFVQLHNYLEQALEQVGFAFGDSLKHVDGDYVYSVTFKALDMREIDQNDGFSVKEVTDSVRLVTDTLGWMVNEAVFPLYSTNGGCAWMVDDGNLSVIVDSSASTVSFKRI